jgi:hypothetical protein
MLLGLIASLLLRFAWGKCNDCSASNEGVREQDSAKIPGLPGSKSGPAVNSVEVEDEFLGGTARFGCD